MNSELFFCGILFIIPSVLFLIFPVAFLRFGSKWKYKDNEPSDIAIVVGRIASILGILFGVTIILLGVIWDKL